MNLKNLKKFKNLKKLVIISLFSVSLRVSADTFDTHSNAEKNQTLDILLNLHNRYRVERGAATLCLSSKLLDTANKFCRYMANTDDFAHRSRDGSRLVSRVEQSGYQWSSLGENIGTGYKNELGVMIAWINSPSHEINIRNPIFTQVGFARCNRPERPNYWVAVFGTSTTESCIGSYKN
ncbi:MAG: hypothetical protein RL344_473 [Pseudomonadota bacterium]|jgi:uncharacterized protein YkwD